MSGLHKLRLHPQPLLSIILILILGACGPSSWRDVTSFETASGKIEAGDLVRIEPNAFAPVEIQGADFSMNKFNFNGTRPGNSGNLELLATVTLMASEGDFHKTETQTGEAILWAAGDPEKDIVISFINLPAGSSFSGKGLFYFYITDKDDNCVSNIVAWPVTFK